MRNPHCEQMFSALLPTSDVIRQRSSSATSITARAVGHCKVRQSQVRADPRGPSFVGTCHSRTSGADIRGDILSQQLCRFSDAGMRRLSTRCGGRRPKSANARSRGSVAPGSAASAMGIVCWGRSRWWTRREQNASTTSAFWHERCTRGFLMFLARVISNGCAWQKQHIPQPLRD